MRTGMIVVAAGIALLMGCGAGSGSHVSGAQDPPSSPLSSPGAPTSSATTPPHCPNPDGQVCLGRLAAGTYDTTLWQPGLKYTVPAGWSNFEDTPGNFLLVPPTGRLRGVNADTSDFIGVYTSVLAHGNTCLSSAAPGVGASPAAIVRWIEGDPAFRASAPQHVAVGGLSGSVVTVRVAKDWRMTCHYSHGSPVSPLIVGSLGTYLDHNVIPGQATRLYLLSYDSGTMAIEVVDIKDAGHLAAYSQIVRQFVFSS